MSDDLIDQRLGQYLITEVIARGGMATVYKATQTSLDRVVAIKVLRHDADPQFISRFKREARATAALQHHNILPIHDYNDQNGLLYLVLQYVEDGRTLSGMLGKPMATLTALQLMSHIMDALDYAHKRGVIHRDIKPSNILMPSPNWPMLADFGIAKLMNDTQLQLTMSNQVIGTAMYLAPEQAMGKPIDARTDLYSAGVVLYELVTGRVPFDGDTPMEVWSKHVYEAPPPPRSLNPDLPASLEALLLRALAKKPDERYQSIAEMASDMERVAHMLTLNRARSQITNLYEGGIQAFEQGQWDAAVDQLGKLVALDPGYEDANELLEAAREALQRARIEAREQIELVRLRHQSGIQQQIRPATEANMEAPAADSPAGSPVTDATTLSPAIPSPRASAPATMKLPALDEPTSLATRQLDVPAHSMVEAPVAGIPPLLGEASTNSAVPAMPPTTARRRLPLLGVAAAAVALVLLALFFMLRGGRADTSGTATAAAQITAAGAPTPGGAVVGQAATAPPATAVPTTAPSATAVPATAVPTTAPPPDPSGTQVYADDFADAKKSGMANLVKATDFQRGIHPPGVYHMLVQAPDETRVELFARQAYQNFSAKIDLNDNSDDFTGAVAQGMVFRARDRRHFYALLIDPRAGKYRLIRQDGDQLVELIPWTNSALIKLQKEVNRLRVDAADAAFTVYLNDAKLADFADPTYERGMIGFMVANVDAQKPHMHFDNLAIWSSDAPASASNLAPVRKNPNGDLVLIPGGEFILGSNTNRDEPPQMLQLADFYIDRAEVTNAEYQRCVAANTCQPPIEPGSYTHPSYYTDARFASYPVINVSWRQAQSYCAWAGKRLPTEAEWEKAAGWNSATREKVEWPWDNEFKADLLNSDESKIGDTTAVGKFPPELNGTVDMAGNVAEWTSSLARPYPYDAADGREDPKATENRIYRGGSWAQTEGKARVISRIDAKPSVGFPELGFRCAMTP